MCRAVGQRLGRMVKVIFHSPGAFRIRASDAVVEEAGSQR